MAFVVALGASCKKEVSAPVKTESVKSIKKADIRWDLPGASKPTSGYDDSGNPTDDGIGGYPEGANTFPHNTGACYCGQYPSCHPQPTNTPQENCDPCQTYPPK